MTILGTPAAAVEVEFVLSDIELREVVQSAVAHCYERNLNLGVVADWWAADLLERVHGKAPFPALCAVLGCDLATVRALLDEVRAVGRSVFEEETGLPARW